MLAIFCMGWGDHRHVYMISEKLCCRQWRSSGHAIAAIIYIFIYNKTVAVSQFQRRHRCCYNFFFIRCFSITWNLVVKTFHESIIHKLLICFFRFMYYPSVGKGKIIFFFTITVIKFTSSFRFSIRLGRSRPRF